MTVAAPDSSDDQSSSVERLIKRGAAWKLSGQVVMQVVRLVFAFLLAHLLDPAEYGIAGIALLVSGFVLVFSDLAFGAALIQRPTITEEDRSTTFWISVGSGALFTVIGIAIAGPVADFFHEPEVKGLFAFMSTTFIITSLGSTQRALMTREMNFARLEIRLIVGTIVGGLVGVVAAFAGFGAWAIISQYVVFSIVSTVLLWIVSPWRPHLRFSRASARSLGGFSTYVLGNRLLYVSEDTASNALIGRILGPTALGLFVVATNVVLTPLSRITIPVAEVLFPAFSRMQEDRARIGSLWLRSLPYVAGVATPALIGLVVVAPDFVAVFLGQQWADVTPLLQVLAWVGLVRSIQGWSASVVLAVNRADVIFKASLVSLVVSVGSIIAGSLLGGVVIVAVTYAVVTTLLVQIPYLWFVARLVDLRLTDVFRALSGVVQASGLMAVVIIGARIGLVTLGASPAVTLAILIPLGIVTYAGACRWRAPDIYARASDVVLRRRRDEGNVTISGQGSVPSADS